MASAVAAVEPAVGNELDAIRLAQLVLLPTLCGRRSNVCMSAASVKGGAGCAGGREAAAPLQTS
jgi:hypothetical protein